MRTNAVLLSALLLIVSVTANVWRHTHHEQMFCVGSEEKPGYGLCGEVGVLRSLPAPETYDHEAARAFPREPSWCRQMMHPQRDPYAGNGWRCVAPDLVAHPDDLLPIPIPAPPVDVPVVAHDVVLMQPSEDTYEGSFPAVVDMRGEAGDVMLDLYQQTVMGPVLISTRHESFPGSATNNVWYVKVPNDTSVQLYTSDDSAGPVFLRATRLDLGGKFHQSSEFSVTNPPVAAPSTGAGGTFFEWTALKGAIAVGVALFVIVLGIMLCLAVALSVAFAGRGISAVANTKTTKPTADVPADIGEPQAREVAPSVSPSRVV